MTLKVFTIKSSEFLNELNKYLPQVVHLNVDIDGIIINNKIKQTDIVLTIGNYPNQKETEFHVDRKSKIGKIVEKLFRELLKTHIKDLGLDEPWYKRKFHFWA